MEIVNVKQISTQNVPGESKTQVDGHGFSQIFANLMGLVDMEVAEIDLELNPDLDMSHMDMELDTEVDGKIDADINPDMEETVENENLIFNPMNPHWMILNQVKAVDGDIEFTKNGEMAIEEVNSNPVVLGQAVNKEFETNTDVKISTEDKKLTSDFKDILAKEDLVSREEVGIEEEIVLDSSKVEKETKKAQIPSDKEETIDKEAFVEETSHMENTKSHIQNPIKDRIGFRESENAMGLTENVSFDENIDIVNDAIVKLSDLKVDASDKSMQVRLHPEELGSIDISLKMEEGKLVAKILVENDKVRELFSKHIEQLSDRLSTSNIGISQVKIDLNLSANNPNHSFKEHNQNRNQYKTKGLRAVQTITANKLAVDKANTGDGLDILV